MMAKIKNFFKAIACITCLTVQMNNVNAQTWPPMGMNGSGTAGDPWQITDIAQLAELAAYVNAGNGSQTIGKYYRLMNDIDYPLTQSSAAGWSPIGNNATGGAVFQGNFDGNGKVISNIYINREAISFIGLFGYVSAASISGLGIETRQIRGITGGQYVGGLIGRSDNSTIESCYVSGNVTGSFVVGGLVGISYNSVIYNSYAVCDVKGANMGGFIGINHGTVQTSYAGGNIDATGNQAGGFVGTNYNTIIDCYAAGNITGTGSYIGGFAGINRDGSITYCYASGSVAIATGDFIGGLTGENSATLRNCAAANAVVSGGVFNINRVAGANTGNLSHNYAFDGMAITPNGGNAGISKDWNTLMSFDFYNTGGNWFNNSPWRIDKTPNPAKSWIICDGETLPLLQWQWEGTECDPVVCDFSAFGTGAQGDPYLIYYPCQLADLAAFVNSGNGAQTAGKYFKLMNDLDLTDYSYGEGWEPIGYGYYYHYNTQFNGNFDGNGKIVTNLKINRYTYDPIGLFGSISNAVIHDLGIEECDIKGGFMAGSLVGPAYLSTIKSCYATGIVTSMGYLQYLSYAGGLVGEIYYSVLENSYSACDAIGAKIAGGLVGQQSSGGTINNCYAAGNAIGTTSVGGLIGANISTIRNCVAANPSVYGGSSYSINSIAGSNGGGIFSNNYAFDGMVISPVPNGGEPGISTPMATLMSFNFYNTGGNWFNNIPWSINDVENTAVTWGICDGKTLPFLQWQGFNCGKSLLHAENHEEDGAAEQNAKPAFSVFPNPASGSITISSGSDFHAVETVDLLGRVVHYQQSNGNKITLNVSGYGNGIYFVRIMTENGVKVQKFVKK